MLAHQAGLLHQHAHAGPLERRRALAGLVVDDALARSRTATRSTSTGWGTRTPKRAASRAVAAIFALRSMTLVGTHP